MKLADLYEGVEPKTDLEDYVKYSNTVDGSSDEVEKES